MSKRPTQEQIDAAVAQEFGVETPSEIERQWVPDAAYRFSIPGPVALMVTSDCIGDDIDPLTLQVQVGPMTLHLDWDGAEALTFALLQEQYGQQWARLIMALCARCPVNFETTGPDGELNSLPDSVVQALWRAAHSYRDRWPARGTGFNDHIWGVPTPKGVDVQ